MSQMLEMMSAESENNTINSSSAFTIHSIQKRVTFPHCACNEKTAAGHPIPRNLGSFVSGLKKRQKIN